MRHVAIALALVPGLVLAQPASERFTKPDSIRRLPAPVILDTTGMFQARFASVGDDIFIAGQPTERALREMKARGVTTVINLRMPDEMQRAVKFDEPKLVAELGMRYVYLPVRAGTGNPYTPATLAAFTEALHEADGKVLLHCTIAWRASHLWAAYLIQERGIAEAQALENARAINLMDTHRMNRDGTQPVEDFLGRRLPTLGRPSPAAQSQAESRILVFSRTAGYRHSSIEPGIAAIQKLGRENGFAVVATEDATAFTDANLMQYQAVVFLNTTGDVLDPRQQDAFERYIRGGGGWVGVHAATDTEYDWPWYGRLAGAYFAGHPNNPNVRRGTFRVLDKAHLSTDALPDRWVREDEFYNFKSIAPDLRVLVDIDETSYQGGTNGDRHPMSWYHAYDGGRAFYTNMGHTDAAYSEPLFLRHLLGGIRWAMSSGR